MITDFADFKVWFLLWFLVWFLVWFLLEALWGASVLSVCDYSLFPADNSVSQLAIGKRQKSRGHESPL
jgi:hypothetical protein